MLDYNGFIKLHRRILDWEWYRDIPVRVLFEHLILKANYKNLRFCGENIQRGELATSRRSLAAETGLSEQQVRTALDKLRGTGEISSQAKGKFTLIRINNYAFFQNGDDFPLPPTQTEFVGEVLRPCESSLKAKSESSDLKPEANPLITRKQPQVKKERNIILPQDISCDISSPKGKNAKKSLKSSWENSKGGKGGAENVSDAARESGAVPRGVESVPDVARERRVVPWGAENVSDVARESGAVPWGAECVPDVARESGAVPWGAECVPDVARESGAVPWGAEESGAVPWGAENVLDVARESGVMPRGAENVPKPKPEKFAVFARKRFSPPSLDEVALYCAERNNQVNPEKWYDYYSANGWKVGKNSMKDWKAAVRLWENQLNSSAFSSAFSSAISSHDDVQKCADDIERKYGLEARKRFLKGLINSHGVT